LNVGDENIEESECREQFMIEASEDEGQRHLSQDDATAEDLYNFDVSVALMEIQLDAEFTEAIQEIDGERVFPFSQ
jgi:hypothetical protein